MCTALLHCADGIVALEKLWSQHRKWPSLFKYLLQGHARARQCGPAPVADGYAINDRVETVAAYPGLWHLHERAIVTGLGPVNHN